MPITTLPALISDTKPETEPAEVPAVDLVVVHQVCCDEDVALCGENVENEPWVYDDEEGGDCPICLVTTCLDCDCYEDAEEATASGPGQEI